MHMPSRALHDIQDACLAELNLPKSVRLTVPQDTTLRTRLLYIIVQVDDAKVASRLFREAMDGI